MYMYIMCLQAHGRVASIACHRPPCSHFMFMGSCKTNTNTNNTNKHTNQ